jgi:hypothetical protein
MGFAFDLQRCPASASSFSAGLHSEIDIETITSCALYRLWGHLKSIHCNQSLYIAFCPTILKHLAERALIRQGWTSSACSIGYHRQLAERVAGRFLTKSDSVGRHEALANYFALLPALQPGVNLCKVFRAS